VESGLPAAAAIVEAGSDFRQSGLAPYVSRMTARFGNRSPNGEVKPGRGCPKASGSSSRHGSWRPGGSSVTSSSTAGSCTRSSNPFRRESPKWQNGVKVIFTIRD